jgi:hypothetical protein
MATKAQLVTQLKKLGIPIPDSAKVVDMEHRLNYWKGGEGYLVRLLRNPRQNHANHPVMLLKDKSNLYWLPNSKMADDILSSRIVLVLGRSNKPSNDAILLDVPSDYDSRWYDGGNNDTDS